MTVKDIPELVDEEKTNARRGGLDANNIATMKLLYAIKDNSLERISVIMSETKPKDTRDVTAKSYKAGAKGFKNWFSAKINVLCARGSYNKTRPAYLERKFAKDGEEVFRLTELGRKKIETIIKEEAEEAQAQAQPKEPKKK